LALALLNASTSSSSSSDTPAAYLFWFGVNVLVVAVVATVLGLPWHAYCQRQGWTNVHAYWTVGLITGVLPGAAWTLPSGFSLIAAFVLAYGAMLGGITGLVAWLIRRPDRDAANPPTPAP
jgi:hypothetical protein